MSHSLQAAVSFRSSRRRRRSSSCGAVAALVLVGPLHAGTFSSSTTAPPVNAADIANLATQTGSDKWFFQTADEANPSDAAKGQTFITGATSVQLRAVTYKISAGNMKAAPTTYRVRIGTVSGTTFTQIASEICNQATDTATGAYMTWTLTTPVTLAANTTYGVDVAMDSGVSWQTGIPYLSYTGNITNARIGTYYDSGDMGVGNATITLTSAQDWYEVAAAYTDPTKPTSKPITPYPLPDPDASTGTGTKPVKVFILSGQSNMVGFGRVAGTGTDTLQSVTRTELKFPNLITSTNAWTVRNDVLYRGVISALGDAPLAPGFGADTDSFGPELGFGHVVGFHHDEPVLIIKTSIGNRALGWDFLPPGSVPYTYSGRVYPGYGDYDDYPSGGTPPVTGPWYAGKQFDDSFLDEEDMGPKAWASGIAYISGCYVKSNGKVYVSKSAHTSAAGSQPGIGANWATFWNLYSVTNVVDILDSFATEYPQWASRGFEIAGFGWFQGWNDGQSTTTAWAIRYEQNMARFIRQLRLYYEARFPGKIKPKAPFVTVTCGFDGWAAAGNRLTIVNAQLAVGNPTLYPEFAGNVRSMEGRGYWRTSGPNTAQNYHYYHNAETYILIGDAMGRGMLDLLHAGGDYATWAAQWPTLNLGAPDADYDGDGVTNDKERLWGLNPAGPTSFNPIAYTSTLKSGFFNYTRRLSSITGLNYTVWTSPNLTTWTQDTGASQTLASTSGNVQTITVRVSSALLAQPKLFVQVRAAP